uniref:Hsp90 co-chaperone Cdc37 n=1 Tax=Junco hyemalis TaxID=40217 RepID=A0A8C5JQD9_JUNHY
MVDYSVWDHIEVSDDEDETHPNIDTASLFRWRHQVRLGRPAATPGPGPFPWRPGPGLPGEAGGGVRLLVGPPWGFPPNHSLCSFGPQSVFNVKPEEKEETEEQKEKKHKTFVERYEKQIKHFGMLRRWDDSQKYLSDNPHLVCEETANYLVIWCIDLEVEEKHALMEQVAHQTIVMQFILELAKSLKVDPRACFRQFFTKIKTADQQYLEGFTEELEAFKERVRGRARARLEKALREYEEEERQKRLGPGGLDPVEVYESLPAELQKCFDVKDVQMLQDTISKMDPTEAKYHMQRCIDSGLWVPNAKGGDGAERGAGEAAPPYEEIKKENGGGGADHEEAKP